MLFNSLPFLYIFMPLTLLGLYITSKKGHSASIYWLAAASYIFYAYWVFWYVYLLIASVAINIFVAKLIVSSKEASYNNKANNWFALGIAFNLLLIAWFKYADLAIMIINDVAKTQYSMLSMEIPPGISFYTFTQIAYLADIRSRRVEKYDAIQYSLFVAYFPHLMSGPLLQHHEVMPQLSSTNTLRLCCYNICIGLLALTIGLSKKLFIADYIANFSTETFAKADKLINFSVGEAIFAALAYSLQIYYDFSGYCDIAMGISIMLGVSLPLNFAMPYKATSLIDFWRRWHISLSRFIRNYVYIPLGGNRRGELKKYWNIILSMTLCGIWHGANYTFVAWGFLHGILLIINHTFRKIRIANHLTNAKAFKFTTWLLTFSTVTLLWIVFRTNSIRATTHYFTCLLGQTELSASANISMFTQRIYVFIISILGATIVPDTYKLLKNTGLYLPVEREMALGALSRPLQPFRFTRFAAVACGATLALCTIKMFMQTTQAPFLYFQF